MQIRKKLFVPSLLSLVLLQACGGGGGSSYSPASASVPSNRSTTTPPAASFIPQSAVGRALQGGLYAISYGMGSINLKEDKSVWRTTLVTLADKSQRPTSVVYSGNDQGGNDVLADAVRPLFDPAVVNGRYNDVLDTRFDDATSKLLVGRSAESFTPSFDWELSVEEADLAGQSIQDFLTQNRSLTKPIEGLAVAGTFAANSQSFRIRYRATADRLVYGKFSPFIHTQEEFERSYYCGASGGGGTRLGIQAQANGTFSILELADVTGCTNSDIAAGTVIGTGKWMRKTTAGTDYVEFQFPTDISPARYDATFLPSEYEAGVKLVMLPSEVGGWSSGFLIPAGRSFQARNLALNKIAADSVKSAVGM